MNTTTVKTYPELIHAERYQVEAARAAMAREFARMFHVTDEVIAAKVAMDEAVAKYRDAVRKAVQEQVKQ